MCKKLTCLSSFILLLGLVVPCIGVNTDPGLMGWWPLDGHATDVSGNDRHGIVNGTPQFGPGMYGLALELDGDECRGSTRSRRGDQRVISSRLGDRLRTQATVTQQTPVPTCLTSPVPCWKSSW